MTRLDDLEEISRRVPFNRRHRRRLETSRGIIVHLFSGSDSKKWTGMKIGGCEVLGIDVSQGEQFNLHREELWGYLWHLASSGRLVGVIGGPPCRTVS